MTDKQYAERDIMALDISGNHYSRHISAMTSEGLHSKSDIAAELAWRDARIAELEARTVNLPDLRQVVSGDRYVWSDGIFNYIQDLKTILTAAGIKWESE